MAQGASRHVPDHLERACIDAGDGRDQVVVQADLGLKQEAPERPHHGRGQHHRQQDDRGPQAVAAETLVDQQRKREAEQHLEQDRPEHEMRRDLHRMPDVGIGENTAVVLQPHPVRAPAGPIRLEIGEGELDGPDQREDIDRQQQQDGRSDKDPGDGAVGDPAQPARQGLRRGSGGTLSEAVSCGRIRHGGYLEWRQMRDRQEQSSFRRVAPAPEGFHPGRTNRIPGRAVVHGAPGMTALGS